MDDYKRNFIKEYIRARNEIIPNANVMRIKWRRPDGAVALWSSLDVYAKFTETRMWRAFMQDAPGFSFSCPVEFHGIDPRGPNRYAVRFRYVCSSEDADGAGQIPARDFIIAIGLSLAPEVRWGARLENPLGLQVSEYAVESGVGDPLDFE
jgi:type IV secretory pathway component VirB8